MNRPPLPPFTAETAAQRVRIAEDAWDTRDRARVASAYTPDSRWPNRVEFLQGRAEIEAFLTRKWSRELDYRLIKELWAFRENRIAVRFAYEWRDDSGHWFRSYGNENWEFDENGLMRVRIASINDLPIEERQSASYPSHRHGVAEAGGGMGIDRDLCDLSVGKHLGPLRLQRRNARRSPKKLRQPVECVTSILASRDNSRRHPHDSGPRRSYLAKGRMNGSVHHTLAPSESAYRAQRNPEMGIAARCQRRRRPCLEYTLAFGDAPARIRFSRAPCHRLRMFVAGRPVALDRWDLRAETHHRRESQAPRE
jgi:nuclear transport factor 2 (NTF2) superfamily protein